MNLIAFPRRTPPLPANLPAWHRGRGLDDLSTDGIYAHTAAPITLARKWVDRIRTGPRPTKGLWFHGDLGNGKTTVGAAVAVELDCTFWPMRDLTARCKEEFNLHVREPVVERVVRTPVLVLDDVGKQRRTDWVLEVIRDVVERRFDRDLLTLYTSNPGPAEMAVLLGPAAYSRFAASVVEVPFEGPDLRAVA